LHLTVEFAFAPPPAGERQDVGRTATDQRYWDWWNDVTPKFGRGLSPLPDRATARPWSEIESQFAKIAELNPEFEPLASLARHLADSGFVEAGLCGATSMHDIVLGRSVYAFQNPHLRVEYDFEGRSFQLIYVDGSTTPWERNVAPGDIKDAIDSFLTKSARWYRHS
jgi:hypothetical protein